MTVYVRYIVRVSYREEDGELRHKDYSFLASSRENAKMVAEELFGVEINRNIPIRIGVKYKSPSAEEVADVRGKIDSTVSALSDIFECKSYYEFIESFTQFEGYAFEKQDNMVSFWFDFQNFKFNAVYTEEQGAYINNTFIYKGVEKTFVVKDNGATILLGS